MFRMILVKWMVFTFSTRYLRKLLLKLTLPPRCPSLFLQTEQFEFIAKYVSKLVSPAKSSEGQQHNVAMLAKVCEYMGSRIAYYYYYNIMKRGFLGLYLFLLHLIFRLSAA